MKSVWWIRCFPSWVNFFSLSAPCYISGVNYFFTCYSSRWFISRLQEKNIKMEPARKKKMLDLQVFSLRGEMRENDRVFGVGFNRWVIIGRFFLGFEKKVLNNWKFFQETEFYFIKFLFLFYFLKFFSWGWGMGDYGLGSQSMKKFGESGGRASGPAGSLQ